MRGKAHTVGVRGAALAALVTIAGVLGACGGGSEQAPGGNGTMVVSRSADPSSLDPAQEITIGGGLETLTAFYERLVNLTPEGEVVPALATSWMVSDDKTTYTFELRKGVTFHDGSPFDAESVRYTWKRIMGINGPAAQYWEPVKDIEVVSSHKVRIELKRPTPSFLATLAGQRGIYMGPSRSCVEKHEKKEGDWAVEWMNSHECGTGPYTLDSWNRGRQLVFVRYDDYWRGWDGPHADRYVQKIVKEPSTVQLLLTQGEIDIAADALPIEIIDQLEKSSSVKVVSDPTSTIDQFTFNMDSKPTSDIRVRRAIALAFDYEKAIQQAYHGHAQRVYGSIPPTIWPEIPEDAVRFEHNPAKAKQLLAEAGYANGLTLDMAAIKDNNQWNNLILALQSDLRDAGVKLEVNYTTWPVLFEKLGKPAGKKPFDMAAYQMWAAIPDPIDILMWWNTDAIEVINPGWGNADTDALLEEAARAVNHQHRVELYQEVIRRMNADVPAIWIDHPDNLTAMRKDVQGYEFVPFYVGLLDFYALHKATA